MPPAVEVQSLNYWTAREVIAWRYQTIHSSEAGNIKKAACVGSLDGPAHLPGLLLPMRQELAMLLSVPLMPESRGGGAADTDTSSHSAATRINTNEEQGTSGYSR